MKSKSLVPQSNYGDAETYKATIDKFKLKVEKSLKQSYSYENGDTVMRHLIKITLLSCNQMTNKPYDKAYVREIVTIFGQNEPEQLDLWSKFEPRSDII